MNKKISVLLIALTLSLITGLFSLSHAQEEITANPKAVELLNKFLTALSTPNFEESAKACVPFLHKTLLNSEGTNISTSLRDFSFKKAHTAANHYVNPVKVTRVRKTNQTQVGFGASAEAGEVDDYFIAKKEGDVGLPAPVKVFFPANGGEPSILYIGSL